jgi:phosphoglucosamine mutase
MPGVKRRQYFGTDGVRGRAGEPPMTAAFALRLGSATAEQLRSEGVARPTVLVGQDTRASSPMLAAALSAGLTARGADVIDVGVIPTPGVAFLTGALDATAGVMVSASHNPYEDNGIKLFDADGHKLPDAAEEAIEARMAALDPAADDLGLGACSHDAVGRVRRYRHEERHYERHLLSVAPYLDGLRVGIDVAHGAAFLVAPRVFTQIGARLDVINAAPDGRNINVACGSTHPEALIERVTRAGLDVGVTFDGDADRALMIDGRGRLVSGDHMLAIAAVVRRERTVVATSMTNLGVERWLASQGIGMERVQVGDRYVFERLRQAGLRLGGEQSGHLLFLDKSSTGDGILSALQVLSACRSSGRKLDSWVDEIPVFPQALVSIPVGNGDRSAIAGDERVQRAVATEREALGDAGRVDVRPSGTEPVVRVMVEASDDEVVRRALDAIGAVIRGVAAGIAAHRVPAPSVAQAATMPEAEVSAE